MGLSENMLPVFLNRVEVYILGRLASCAVKEGNAGRQSTGPGPRKEHAGIDTWKCRKVKLCE